MRQFPKRKNIRLKDYDYSKPGMYFITICTKNRQQILSQIIDKPMSNDVGVALLGDPYTRNCNELMSNLKLTHIGKIIEENIEKCGENKNYIMDKYIIMPNHIHLIIEILPDKRVAQSSDPYNT